MASPPLHRSAINDDQSPDVDSRSGRSRCSQCASTVETKRKRCPCGIVACAEKYLLGWAVRRKTPVHRRGRKIIIIKKSRTNRTERQQRAKKDGEPKSIGPQTVEQTVVMPTSLCVGARKFRIRTPSPADEAAEEALDATE